MPKENMEMDKFSRAYYEMSFENEFLRKKGTAFQDLFGDIMEKRYPYGDFIRVRPWGSCGDRKNDGYLRSERTLFQVYAPNDMGEAGAIRKIDEDFRGALPHWKQYFDRWIFVHNAREGLGPGVTKKLLDLDQEFKDIEVTRWGFEELRRNIFDLSDDDISAILGAAPSSSDFAQLGFEKLKPVLKRIARQPAPLEPDLSKVPRDKIELNRLSENTEILIVAGRKKSTLVADFFSKYPDPEFGDEVVEAFRSKYQELRTDSVESNQIFQELQTFAGGEKKGDTAHQAAVLAVLAYLFDQCDIYERSLTGG